MVDYLSGGKGVIPYEMIKEWEDLNIAPTLNEKFFAKTAFYSLKNSTITDQEYEDVQKLFSLMKMSNLLDLNALYNFQDTIILTEVFENRASIMHEKFGYNSLKCSSASTLSEVIQRHTSKVIISFPINADIIELMEKTLIGGMNIVNRRVEFDSNIFIKGKEQKLVHKIKNKATNEMENKRVSTLILKMDENNQCGNAVTQPLPIGCIKKEPQTLNIRELCLLLSGLSHLDAIGHLFVVDLEFNVERTTEKEFFFNEIYTPSFEKKKVLPARDRSVFQLLDAIRLKDNTTLNIYKCTTKTHSTMDKKFLVPLYAEQLKFLLECCCWTVTKIHQHFTFRQEMFKKDFVISNQIARQYAKTSMKKIFIS